MILTNTISMRLASLVTAFVLVAGVPAPALMTFAEEVHEAPPAPQEQTTSSETQHESAPGQNGEDAAGLNGDEEAALEDGEGEDGEASDQPAIIETGNASSTATNVDEANTTIVDADGEGDTTLDIDNDLAAESAASSTATTGENDADGGDGHALVKTGNADAFTYIISLFNVAVTNSAGSVLFLRNPLGPALDFTERIMSIFSDVLGTNGECSLLACTLTDAIFSIFADNVAEVSNVAVARSTTGGNSAASDGGFAGIATGDASAFAGIVNFGNLLIADSRYLIILMTNQGGLEGDIILPDGDFFKGLSSGAALGVGSSLAASSTAEIENNGTAHAETGGNEAIGDEGAGISSGNAHANAATMNFVNQIGAPLCFIVNVGGEWRGDVVRLPEGFAREAAPFGEIVCGRGGAAERASSATNIDTTNYAKILNTAIAEAVTGDNHAEGLAAAIETGDADAFVQILNLVNQTIIGQDWIFALFTVTGDWDGDLVFGAAEGEPDIVEQIIEQAVRHVGMSAQWNTSLPDITLVKTASVQQVASPATVDYEIVVDNAGGVAHDVLVSDTLAGPDGGVIGKQMWNLGTIEANEKITIAYTISFAHDVKPGYYTNTAVISGGNLGSGVSNMTAKHVIEILPAGAEVGPRCEPLLTEYIRPGAQNSSSQVRLLQSFLNDAEGEALNVNGVYDAATIAAVNRFQTKYASDILAPWGITRSTGNVYYTTQKKVNELYCEDEIEFELTTEQILEMSRFRTQAATPNRSVDQLLQTNEVGMLKPPAHTVRIPFVLPSPQIPAVHVPIFEAVSAQDSRNPFSLFNLPLNLLSSWLLTAVPFVDAWEM